MIYILQIIFILILLIGFRKANNCYKILILFQILSFCFAPLVGCLFSFETPLTIFNTFFCLVNLFLIIFPWKKVNIKTIIPGNYYFFLFFKKILYFVLFLTIINNIIVFIILRYYISDPAVFKALEAYHLIYEKIPIFGFLFRFSYISRSLGLLALPNVFYYMGNKRYKQSVIALLMTSSTLIAAIATYSRAYLLSFVILFCCLYFYVEKVFDMKIHKLIRDCLYFFLILMTIIFANITIKRFNSPVMNYYKNNIPEVSYIKSPSLYSVFNYTSQGFPNGIEQLEVHEYKDVLKGEPLFYDLLMALSFFHLTSWTKEDYEQRMIYAYNKNSINKENTYSVFHGYTCSLVKMFGYICAMLVDVFYFLYVRKKSNEGFIKIKELSILLFLLWASINSIFYCDYAVALFPFLFFIMVLLLYKFLKQCSNNRGKN